jgi:poly-beta-1,6-N-acetyl-D-glucosamine synthase
VSRYVLITPVKNECSTIGFTIQSVVRQTLPPLEWVIVSDGSTDGTDAIILEAAKNVPFIRYLRLDNRPKRGFDSVVFVLEVGIRSLITVDYDYIGVLDGDVRFPADYYHRLCAEFSREPSLGLIGGWVRDVINGEFRHEKQNWKEVAGATQFFTRECFRAIGGLTPLKEGGWDAVTCVSARMNGYRTQTFPSIVMEHLKPRNYALGNPISRKWQMGVRDYILGSAAVFEFLKCASRISEVPWLIGSVARFCGYCSCFIRGKTSPLPAALLQFTREEQWARVLRRQVKPLAVALATSNIVRP